MKKTFTVACMVATLIVFAATMLTGCEKEKNDFARDRLGATEHTTTVHDSIPPVLDTTIVFVEDTHTYNMRVRQWHNRWLGVSGGYLIGEDSVVLTKYEGATLLQTWRTTAQHRGTAALSVGTASYPASVVGDSCWLAAMGNGVYSGSMAGHNVVMTLGPQAIQGPVVLNGQDWTAYLVAHEAIGQRVRFDADGNARGYIIDADGRAAGTVTTPYSTTNPEDTTRRLVSVDTSYVHLSTTPNGAWSGNTVTWSCNNRRTITRHYNRAPMVEIDSALNFSIYFPYIWSVSGNATPAMDGVTVNFSTSGTATWGGLTVTLTAQPRQCSITPIPLPCQHSLTTGTLHWNGGNPYVTINGTLEGTPTSATHNVPATNRVITSRDTSWNGCGHLVSSSLTSVMIQHTLARTGVETIHYNIAPLTETHTVSESTMYYSQYMVSGSANSSAIGTTASFSGNTVTIGGVTLTLTPGAQPWCVLTYTTATLTSNGLVVTFTYNGGTGTVTIPVTWQTPSEEWEDLVYLVVTDGYEYQIFSATSQRHQFMVAIVYNSLSGYKMFWKDVTDAPGTMPTRSSCDSSSITATMYNFYVNAASNGGYATKIIPHNSSTTLYDGVVYSEELSNWWQLTYRLAPSNTQAYVMGGSSWTMAGDSGRNALRGQADLANHMITVDYGGTTRTWYFN